MRNGYTLIELIASMALMAVLSAIAIPYVRGFYSLQQKIQLENAIKELLGDMRLCQQKARTEGCYYNLFFNSDDQSYMIYYYKNSRNYIYKQRKLPEGVSFDHIRSTYENNKLYFNSNGKPMPRACTVALVNNLGQYSRITITVATDYISIRTG